jgi:uncharacterized membrane protein
MLRQLIAVVLLVSGLFAGIAPIRAGAQELGPDEEMLEGKVVSVVSEQRTDPAGNEYLYQTLRVEVTKGSYKGEQVQVVNDTVAVAKQSDYRVGDNVMVLRSVFYDGEEVFYITDYVRRNSLIMLFGIFAVTAMVIGGKWGATSILGMIYSFVIIFKFILPRILTGDNAVIVAIIGSGLIIPVTFSLSHGFKIKTMIAGTSTVLTLILTGILAALAAEAAKLTGFASEEAIFLHYQLGEGINMKGLLLAGMIISSLGILDDITISQASVIAELKAANKKLGFKELFVRGMNVGRDHIASLINTLVLVYAGASLPLLLLFVNNPSPLSEVINIELIADEIVRTFVGSMALILAVPIATVLAAYYFHYYSRKGG